MIVQEDINCIGEWATKLFNDGIVTQAEGCLSLRNNSQMLITQAGADFENFSEDAVVKVNLLDCSYDHGKMPHRDYQLHAALYNKKNNFNVLVHTVLPNTVTSSKAGREVLPLLDDIAQIVGASVKIAAYDEPVNQAVIKSAINSLKRRSGALLKDSGAICGAYNFSDAQAVAQVLEKGCKSFIETEFLGGGKKINFIEANLMRFVYNIKYSKQDVQNR